MCEGTLNSHLVSVAFVCRPSIRANERARGREEHWVVCWGREEVMKGNKHQRQHKHHMNLQPALAVHDFI